MCATNYLVLRRQKGGELEEQKKTTNRSRDGQIVKNIIHKSIEILAIELPICLKSMEIIQFSNVLFFDNTTVVYNCMVFQHTIHDATLKIRKLAAWMFSVYVQYAILSGILRAFRVCTVLNGQINNKVFRSV